LALVAEGVVYVNNEERDKRSEQADAKVAA
jgi:hypothetical protein